MNDRRPRLGGGLHRPRPTHRLADGRLVPWTRVRRSALRRRPHRGTRDAAQRKSPGPGQLDRVPPSHVHGRRRRAARNPARQPASRRPSARGSLTPCLTRDRRQIPASTSHPPLALALPECRHRPPVPYPGARRGGPVCEKGGGGGSVRRRGGRAARGRGDGGKGNRAARAAPMGVLGGNDSVARTYLTFRGRDPAAPPATSPHAYTGHGVPIYESALLTRGSCTLPRGRGLRLGAARAAGQRVGTFPVCGFPRTAARR